MAYVKFWADSSTNLPSSRNSDTLYFVTNTGQLYKGDTLIADKTPDSLPNAFGFNLYANGGTTPLHTYDGSSAVNLKAGAFVQFTESPDGTVTISSADNNTTYDLVGNLNNDKTAYTVSLDDGDSATAADTITIQSMVKSGSSAAAGLVPKPSTTAGTTKYLREDATWATPPDTKVTSVDNHYTPAEDSNSALNASSTTAATWGSTDLITGLKRDAKGHVVGVTSIQMPANPNTIGKNVIGAQNATSNSAQSTNGNVYLTHVDGTAQSSHQIKGSGKVTVTSDANGNITITGAQTTLDDLGLGNAVHFLGTSSSAITDGGTQKPTIDNKEVTPTAGDVVLYNNQEFIYNASNKWELFGDEGSYALKTLKLKAGSGIIVNDATEAELSADITIKNTGVTSVAQGSANGTIAVSVGGATATDVSVKGLAAAAYKAVTDSSSASAISTGTNLVTERDVYYGLPTINGVHNYNSNTKLFAPTAAGTENQVLLSSGSGAPSWVNQSTLSVGSATKATQDGNGNPITSTYATQTALGAVSADIEALKLALTWQSGATNASA